MSFDGLATKPPNEQNLPIGNSIHYLMNCQDGHHGGPDVPNGNRVHYLLDCLGGCHPDAPGKLSGGKVQCMMNCPRDDSHEREYHAALTVVGFVQ